MGRAGERKENNIKEKAGQKKTELCKELERRRLKGHSKKNREKKFGGVSKR